MCVVCVCVCGVCGVCWGGKETEGERIRRVSKVGIHTRHTGRQRESVFGGQVRWVYTPGTQRIQNYVHC